MQDAGGHRRFVSVTGIAAVAIGLLAASLHWRVGGETTALYLDDLFTALAALVAAVMCLRAGARYSGRLRRFWWLFAGACGAWTVAEAIWAVYDLALGQEVPVPSAADIGYLTAIPLAIAALLSHPSLHGGRTRMARSALDGFSIATALLFLSWTLVLGRLWQSTDLTTAGGLVALAYPFGDAVILFFIVLAVRRMTGADRLALWCLLAGLVAISLADSAYAYLTEIEGYSSGGLLDVGWFAGYVAIALGALFSDAGDRVARRAELSVSPLAPVVAPFLPVLLALGVLTIEMHLGRRPDLVALIAALALVALVLVRQALLVLDVLATSDRNETRLVERLHSALLGTTSEGTQTEPAPAAPSPGSRS